MPRIRPFLSVLFLKSNPLLIISVNGRRNSIPSVVLMPVKVNASTLSMPIDCATKDEPQMMAVIRSSTIPKGLVRRIEYSFRRYAKEIYIRLIGFASKQPNNSLSFYFDVYILLFYYIYYAH